MRLNQKEREVEKECLSVMLDQISEEGKAELKEGKRSGVGRGGGEKEAEEEKGERRRRKEKEEEEKYI